MSGERDHYKIWEEGQIPSVIFEITSKSTQKNDQEGKQGGKFELYQQLGVQEYWLFDPRGEWIPEQLKGYRLRAGHYMPIGDARSEVLGLRLTIEGMVLGYYREDTGVKLLAPDELVEARLQAEQVARQEAQRAERAEQEATYQAQRAERMRARLLALGLDPDD